MRTLLPTSCAGDFKIHSNGIQIIRLAIAVELELYIRGTI